MMDRDKKEAIVYIILALILLALSGKVYIDSKGYSCDECSIEFSTKIATTDNYFPSIDISFEELYLPFILEERDKKCRVKWDKVGGFII